MAPRAPTISFSLRRYEPADREAVWSLHQLSISTTEAQAPDDYFADLRSIPESYLAPRGEFLVGFDANRVADTRLIAMGGLLPTSQDRAEIRRMRVHPEYQRRGLGQQLLQALEAQAVRLGFRTLHLETTTSQTAARQLYASAKYRQVGRGETLGFTVVRYEKLLS